ncbi:MAG: hypothetical protein NTV68_13800 [Methanomicrobiales archaeon]|nr:hypothetical protein [Methanomicrobiales archaeon]
MTDRHHREIDCVVGRWTRQHFGKRKRPGSCQVCNGTGRMGVVP